MSDIVSDLNDILENKEDIKEALNENGADVGNDIRTYAMGVNSVASVKKVNNIPADANKNVQLDASNINVDDTAQTPQTIQSKFSEIDTKLDFNLENGETIGSVKSIESFAEGEYSFAEGYGSIAYGDYSHAEGEGMYKSITLTGNANATTYTFTNSGLNVSNMNTNQFILYGKVLAKITNVTGSGTSGTITLSKTLSNIALDSVTAKLYYNSIAIGQSSHADSYGIASSKGSHADSYGKASGIGAHADSGGEATGQDSHADSGGKASGMGAHAENSSIAKGSYSHAEGQSTSAIGSYSHSAGQNSKAYGESSEASGRWQMAYSTCASAQGYIYDANYSLKLTGDANATTYSCTINSVYTLGVGTVLYLKSSETAAKVLSFTPTSVTLDHTLSMFTALNDTYVYIYNKGAIGEYSHTEGRDGLALGNGSHTEGCSNTAEGLYAHAEGFGNHARGEQAHVEGTNNHVLGDDAHGEGYKQLVIGRTSHAEGYGSDYNIKITGDANATTYTFSNAAESPVVGDYIYYNGKVIPITAVSASTITVNETLSPFALNNITTSLRKEGAIGDYSHSEGFHSIAKGESQHVQGKYNIADDNNTYAHIVGNGTSKDARSNAHTLDWYGNAWYQGNVYVRGTDQTTGSHKLIADDDLIEYKYRDIYEVLNENRLLDYIKDYDNNCTGISSVQYVDQPGKDVRYAVYYYSNGYLNNEPFAIYKNHAGQPEFLLSPTNLRNFEAASITSVGSNYQTVDALICYGTSITDVIVMVPSSSNPGWFTELSATFTLGSGGTISATTTTAFSSASFIRLKLTYSNGDIAYSNDYVLGGTVCFSGNTLIDTENGLKKIEDIEVGDKVYSYNQENKTIELKAVDKIYSHTTDKLVSIYTEREIIETTWSHPFYVAFNQKKLAKDLKINDLLRTKQNLFRPIKQLIIDDVNDIEVYEIRVVDNNNYFVGSEGILVYNEPNIIND